MAQRPHHHLRPWLLGLVLLTGGLRLSAQIDVDQALAIGRNAIYFKDYVVSMGYFNQVIGLRPWLADPYYYRAVAKYNLEDYRGAAEDATLAIERNPILPRVYMLRGVANLALQNYAPAVSDFQRVLSFDSREEGAKYNLAVALLGDKQFVRSDSVARALTESREFAQDALRLLAQSAMEQRDTIQASQHLEELLKRDSTYAPAYLLRAQLAAEKKDYRRATAALDKAISGGLEEANLYINRAIMRYHLQDLRGAMSDYSSALRLEPKELTALNNRALLRTQVGEYSLAIQDWNGLLAVTPDNYIARYNRALLQIRIGALREALRDLDVVLSRYPIFAEGYMTRSEVRQRLGDVKGATRDQIHLFDLRNDKAYRQRAQRASGRGGKQLAQADTAKTRSAKDEAIEKYNLLVETPSSITSEKPKFSSPIRGRIQDQSVQASPREALAFSYFAELDADGNQSQVYFAQSLDHFNLRRQREDKEARRLLLRELGSPLTTEDVALVERHLQRLSGQSEKTPSRSFLRGVDYFLLQDLPHAIEAFSEAIQLDPKFALAYYGRAVALMRRSEVEGAPRESALPVRGDNALTDLAQVIALEPTFAYAYYSRATLLARSGAKDEARRDYDRALELNPTLAEAYYNRGLLSFSEGDVPRGTADLSRAGELGLYKAYALIKQMSRKE